jgi:hypothetical protein
MLERCYHGDAAFGVLRRRHGVSKDEKWLRPVGVLNIFPSLTVSNATPHGALFCLIDSSKINPQLTHQA